jgi:hypothetical protein
MRTYNKFVICRLPESIKDKTEQLSKETNTSQSSILREGLMSVLKQHEAAKHEKMMVTAFMTS